MERPHGEIRESPLQTKEKTPPSKLSREMLFLAEQAAEGRLKVLPGKDWALHYPAEAEVRRELLQGLLEGRYTAEVVAHDVKPDALFYNAEDIEKQGLENVSARVRDLSAFIAHYDYPRFARFVESMRGRNIPIDELDRLYTEITQARVQKKVMDAYGYTGKKQIESALRNEADNTIQEIQNLPRTQKVLKALKTNWASEELGLVAPEERLRVISELSGDERKVFESLQSSYREYIQRGDENAYKELTKAIQEDFPKIQKQIETGQSSESMQELQKELEEFRKQAVPPGSPEDLAIPPEDRDEYHTPPPAPGESKEKMQERPIFEIDPALAGYYASGKKSYFDVDTKTWSKKKQLSQYTTSVKGKERSTISGTLDSGIKSLPLPNGYALDASSLKAKKANIEVKRDQNGCFYLEVNGAGSFSVDFLAEQNPFLSQVIPEDTSPLYRGPLSQKTEATISKLIGSPLQKAEQARQYILANHFYPGGGDLQTAQALQYKLRSKSTGDNYLQNIDQSEYLECYSANTKFIAMMRKAGVPTRLVIGHKVEGAKDGKSIITQNTGHAWAEIWDGKTWRRFDATPNPKPEDQKESDKDQKKSEKEPAKEAQDGGIDKPSSSAANSAEVASATKAGKASADKQEKEGKEGEKKNDQKQSQKAGEQKGEKSSESGNPLDQMSEASDNDMQKSESQLQQAREQMDRQMAQKQQLDEKVQNAEKFKELSDLKKELEESGLLDDLKKELEEKLEAKEDQMKDMIKDELDKMVEDGFMDEKKRDEILKELEKKQLEELDRVQKEVEQENRLYNEYEDIREGVMPLVDKWFRYFAERLPRQEEVSFDEDSLTRQGAFNRRAVMKSRNLLFGMVKNPREIKPSIKPRFMASVLVDVSGSMAGEKLKSARKLLVFYSELFSRISEAFGYIRFSIDAFSDSVIEIKGYTQDYDSPQRYDFEDGTRSTIKMRIMQGLAARGGTNMLDGIKKAASDLNKQVEEYPDYASSFYFVGDGGDTYGNAANIRRFLQINESERGFGEHMYSAILLGTESQQRELAEIFGDDHTNVVPDFDELIEKSMDKFDEDLEEYLKNKIK